MGSAEREPQPPLTEIQQRLEADARKFSYFRLVYLLERLYPGAPPVGQLGPASNERIRLRGDTSLVFASRDV